MSRWFLPSSGNVLELLDEQLAVTTDGMDAFTSWSSGDVAQGQRVRDLEHLADTARRRVQTALREAFTTPIDPEDIYVLSERVDRVLNGAKNAVREAEVMQITPNAPLAAMASELGAGTRVLRRAIAQIATKPAEATRIADEAIHHDRRLEHLYRSAMSDLLKEDDLTQVIAFRELYRRYARIGNHVVEVAERVWYAAVK